MKKVLSFMLLAFLNFWIAIASELNVKSNLESWEYNFPIEVNLISNDKEAKIFYYTDWEWRMDNIKEFKNPILLKEDTTIDFYATTKNFEDTLIQTSKYTFNYSKDINIEEKNWKIIINNNSQDIQNIWYWRVEANNLNYEITPNTFIDVNKNYEINYILEDNEKVILYSPNNKVIKNFTFKKPKEIPKIEEKKQMHEEVLNWTQSILEEKTPTLVPNQLNDNQTEAIKESSWFNLNDSLKTSVIDNKNTTNKNSTKENKSNNLYIILGILVLITIYNVWLFLRKSEKFIKMQTKINKIWKK